MHFRPIFSALMRSPVGLILICLQVALTLAIITNSLQIIQTRMDAIDTPSGLDEANSFTISSVGYTKGFDNKANTQQDLDFLKQLPGVRSAIATNSIPLTNSGWSSTFEAGESQDSLGVNMGVYFGDHHFLETTGVELIAGRNFLESEVQFYEPRTNAEPKLALISDVGALKLFPDISSPEEALGKEVWQGGPNNRFSTKIIGVIRGLTTPWRNWGSSDNVVIIPYIPLSEVRQFYLIRTEAGALESITSELQDQLSQLNPERIVYAPRLITEYRDEFYSEDVAMMSILYAVVIMLLIVNALGVIGLVSFWIQQRTKQIGTRRALGATKGDILAYFLTENLIMTGMGLALGSVLTLALNNWLVSAFDLAKLPASYLISGAVCLLLLGLLATSIPARRAAMIDPAIATRSQ